jgi:hypothetical protein
MFLRFLKMDHVKGGVLLYRLNCLNLTEDINKDKSKHLWRFFFTQILYFHI